MKYVDVILPLPLDGMFTYAVPDNMTGMVKLGVRLLVPLGKSKRYTAMATRWRDEKPDFEVKEIIAVLDESPVLLPQQFKLWEWIAEYYMSPLGDIFKAALPSGLKEEEGYKPKTEVYVGLREQYRAHQALNITLDMVAKAARQRQTLSCFLVLSHWDTLENDGSHDEIVEVTREELMNESHCTTAIIKALVDRQILYAYKKEVGRLDDNGDYRPENIKTLGSAQQEAYDNVLRQFDERSVVLLHGVTSSGKTEIYTHLIEKALGEHKQVLYLLPEIALTIQIMSRLKRVFGNRLGIYHSRYSDEERVEIWKKQLSDEPYDVILGARSAVFLPFDRLGLVIIDEEHETSFKQQDPAPRYHARSVAIMLANMYGAKVLLGTATPSMESYYNAQTGKYGIVTLTTRYKSVRLPEIEVVDTKDLRRRKMMSGAFSPRLFAAMCEALEAGKQVILFQNRRGFAPMIQCRDCGWTPKCDNCDVSLTLHKNTNKLTCHYCGFTYTIPTVCPSCGCTDLRVRGYGTEKIEDIVMDTFPEAKVARMDLDTTRTKNAYERIIADFSAGKTNVLIGTQMVTKGLDFGGVSVVGILNADGMLNFPDFRAYEHAFAMMSQVGGRAGRKDGHGLVLLQTGSADLPIIRQVVDNDYDGFYSNMLVERQAFNYPPFSHLIYVMLRHRDDTVVDSASLEMGSRLRQWLGDRVLGPDKPGVAKVKAMNIRKIMLKLENGLDLRGVRSCLVEAKAQTLEDKRYAAVQIYFDVDPL